VSDAVAIQQTSFPTTTVLADGTRVLIRPLVPQDKGDLLRGFDRLSVRSRRFRFFTSLRRLTPRQLQLLTEVDQRDHVALGVRDLSRQDQPGIAIGRLIRLDGEPEVAEFAVTVIDEYQGRGLGSLLIGMLLGMARERGVRTLRGYLLEDNLAMIRILGKLGARMSRDSGNVLRAELAVGPAPAVITTLTDDPNSG
jgi:GNAT superfamily N-acetyltransferase